MEAERKARLGTKWTCYSCGTRFYDLNKPEPLCPRCNADQRESPTFEKPKAKRTRKATKKKAAKKKAKAPALPPDELEEAPATNDDEGARELSAESMGMAPSGAMDGDDSPDAEIDLEQEAT